MNPGIYKATILSHHWRNAKTGSLGLEVQIAIVDEDGAIQNLGGTIWITPKAMGMARHQLKELGFDVDAEDLSALDDGTLLAGRECTVTLRLDNYQGQERLAVTFGGQFKPTPDALAAAQAGLRAAKKQVPATDKDAFVAESKEIAREPGSDIPFTLLWLIPFSELINLLMG